MTAAVVLAVALAAMAPVTFEKCESAGFDPQLVSGLFAAQRPANHPPLVVQCQSAERVAIRRGDSVREVSLADTPQSLRAQTLALVLVEAALGRLAPTRSTARPALKATRPASVPENQPPPIPATSTPTPVTENEPSAESNQGVEKPTNSSTVVTENAAEASLSGTGVPDDERPKEVVINIPSDAPRALSVTPPMNLIEPNELAPGHEMALNLTGGFTLGFGVLAIASVLTGSMLLGLANQNGRDNLTVPGWTMIGIGVASLTAACISVALWFGERENPGAVAIAPRKQ